MRRVLVTGCNRGLGNFLANRFDLNGCVVSRHSRHDNKNCQLVGDISIDSFYDCLEMFVRNNEIDIFVNNAAVHNSQPFLKYKENEIQAIIRTNLTSQILMIQRVYKIFKERDFGTIVNINSLAGHDPSLYEALYCATKFGLRGFSESLQIESIGSNIEILDFYPGAMKTDMCKNRSNYGDLMDPDEIAEMVVTTVLKERSTILPTSVIMRRSTKRTKD